MDATRISPDYRAMSTARARSKRMPQFEVGRFSRLRARGALAPSPAVRRRVDRRRPLLFALVFGIFLVVAAITATAHVIVATTHFSAETLSATVARDRALVRIFVDGNLTPADLAIRGSDPARAELLQRLLTAYVERGEILRVELRSTDGTVVLSNVATLRGVRAPASAGYAEAQAGRIWAQVTDASQSGHTAVAGLGARTAIEEYVPLIAADGEVRAVFAIWRDAAPVLAVLQRLRNDSIMVTLGGAAVLAFTLLFVFRSANTRLARQTRELVEATRRDALTGLFNHGASVVELAGAIETARTTSGPVGLAMIDIDNFRLLNDTYGHHVGDAILCDIADWLTANEVGSVTFGRYGPDEFLVIAPGGNEVIAGLVGRLRDALEQVDIQVGDSERLPLTVSVGICAFPDNAGAVTELLAVAALALREAKASGGDRVVVADARQEDRASAGSLDVLQGLVIAIDTKDRYTKLHSQDVARYALFLAEQLDLDPELRETIKLSGLLHDVGKIGIPEEILRKPGKLTAAEMAVVQQHVRLGDMIVRELPDIETVRAGIRHHHERWDGLGYLDRLAGEEIPLIARILAVADAFSAMTTSRPYRKALPVQEALTRLVDASGTQLQEDLVTAFIQGFESAADPPMPGLAPSSRLWTPMTDVA